MSDYTLRDFSCDLSYSIKLIMQIGDLIAKSDIREKICLDAKINDLIASLSELYDLCLSMEEANE